jgi:hypothetical protein
MAEVARASPLVLTGWEGDEPLRAWLPGRWRRLFQTGQWSRLYRDLSWYIRNEKGPPPVGARTALVRLRRLVPAALPDWLAPEFVQRTRLAKRWADSRYVQARAYYAGSRPRYLESVPWSGVFDRYDAAWIGFPVETAHPLMDLRVIAWLARVPAIPWCSNKRLLREAARGMLPQQIAQRPKAPLSVDPTQAAFRRTVAQLPRRVRDSAPRLDYVVAERLFDTNGVLCADQPLDTRSNAISFLTWFAKSREDKLSGDAGLAESKGKTRQVAP